jgi:O-succinylbenzoic acid--CoA ligase
MVFMRSLLAKCTLVFPESSVPWGSYGPTMISLVPTQMIRLKEENWLKGLKAILIGGDRFPSPYLEAIKDLPVSFTYGMTETCAQVAASAPGTFPMKIFPNRRIRISSEGRILIKGGVGKSLDHDLEFSKDGYLITSDIGTIRENFLEVEKRKDDLFQKGGENISPQEIRNAALKTGLVTDAYIVPIPDTLYGKIPVLFYSGPQEIETTHFKRVLSYFLPPFKIPHRFHRIEEGFKWSKLTLAQLAEKLHATSH